MIRVLVVDDHAVVLSRLRRLVDDLPDMVCVGAAADGLEAVALALKLAPDVILMDMRMPNLDGASATRRIVESGLPSRIIALTAMEDDETFHNALAAGASGFILKGSSRGELAHAIHVVDGGESILSPTLVSRVLRDYVKGSKPSCLVGLKEREVELLRLVGRGLSNDEIATELSLSPTTVKSYVSRLLSATRRRDRAQLVILAYQSGLVTV